MSTIAAPPRPDAPDPARAVAARTVDPLLDAIDRAGEELFGRMRDHRAADALAAVTSNLSDYGLVWVLVAAYKARRPGLRRRRAIAGLAVAGVLSYAVNRAVKRRVGRPRPAGRSERFVPVRRPTSSSFPSGHTLAACCTAVVLSDGGTETALALGFAAAVALSRVHLGAHHLSDVVGGGVIGAVLGLVARAALERLVPAE